MKKLLIFMLLFSISCSKPQTSGQTKYVNIPIFYPISNYLKSTYDEDFFREEHFNYAADIQGKDTTKYFYTSETVIIEDTNRYFLRNCEAMLQNNSLLLLLNDSPFSTNPYELKIIKTNDTFNVQYHQNFSIADSSYKPPIFKIINQNIILDKNNYVSGDSLKGKIFVKILASYFWENKYSDTIHIYGLIKTIVR